VSAAAAPAFDAEQPTERALALLRAQLAAGGGASAGLEARCLVEAACGLDRAGLVAHGSQPLGAAAQRLSAYAARRLSGEPLARILGSREFWGLSFSLSPATLVPRPETETLVEAVLRHCREEEGRDHAWRILDLGTGSGCIAVSLLAELPSARCVGVDRALEALATARRNASRHRVGGRASFVAGDWAAAIAGPFDIVVSNPPYVASPDLGGLATEVREHDPRTALDGGPDGLDAYRVIAAELHRLLVRGGAAFLEIGMGQDRQVAQLIAAQGLVSLGAHPDLAGICRVISARNPPVL